MKPIRKTGTFNLIKFTSSTKEDLTKKKALPVDDDQYEQSLINYRDRKAKKREFRSLWIQRINAGVRIEGLTYAKFINGLNKSKIKIDRKVLAELAYSNPEVFKSIVKKVQSSLN